MTHQSLDLPVPLSPDSQMCLVRHLPWVSSRGFPLHMEDSLLIPSVRALHWYVIKVKLQYLTQQADWLSPSPQLSFLASLNCSGHLFILKKSPCNLPCLLPWPTSMNWIVLATCNNGVCTFAGCYCYLTGTQAPWRLSCFEFWFIRTLLQLP